MESPAVTRIETRSIDCVPDDERHGKVHHQGPFWFVGNFQPFTLALGFVGPSLRLSYSGMLTVVTALDSLRPVQPTRRLRVVTIVVLAVAWFVITPDGTYGAWSWRGITAFVAGIAAEIPFVVLPFFVGPVAAATGDVDIAFIVGLLVCGLVYVLLTRSLDVSQELALIESHAELADPVS